MYKCHIETKIQLKIQLRFNYKTLKCFFYLLTFTASVTVAQQVRCAREHPAFSAATFKLLTSFLCTRIPCIRKRQSIEKWDNYVTRKKMNLVSRF